MTTEPEQTEFGSTAYLQVILLQSMPTRHDNVLCLALHVEREAG